MLVRVVVVAAVVSLASSGCFELTRLDGLRDGDIALDVLDGAGAAVIGASVFAVGTSRVGISDDTGAAVVGPMPFGDYALRIAIDEGNDGVVEAGAYVTVLAPIDALATSSLARLTAFDYGEVVIVPTADVSGTVSGCPLTSLCRVVAFRTAAGVTLPIEGTGNVDGVAGTWSIAGLIAGDIQLAAFAWDRPASTVPLQQLIAATRPTHVGAGSATVGDSGVVIAVATVPANTTAEIALRAPDADAERALTGTANYLVPTTSTFATVGNLAGAVPGEAVTIPVGVFDLSVQVDGIGGRLEGLVGVPGLKAPFVPVTLGGFDCVADSENNETGSIDCNSDGINDVVDTNGDGLDLGDIDTDNDGIRDGDDDDIDGDGVVDSTEPSACRIAGRGGDRDGDCLCDATDPLPDCQSNDPADCTAVVAPVCDRGTP